jgi:methionyl-tRNA formyltransferase
MRFAFAGDRDVSVNVLKYILDQGAKPLALIVPDDDIASHSGTLFDLCTFLDKKHLLKGDINNNINSLETLDLDFIFCIHYPHLISDEILCIPCEGVINLHPAYLPYNRGWHTPSWAILEETPIGATLHFMDSGTDTGDIIYQERMTVSPEDTAHGLYRKLKALEFEIFKKSWPSLVTKTYNRTKQKSIINTFHKKRDLSVPNIQEINLEAPTIPRNLLRNLRALTTNNIEEAAYFFEGGEKYSVQLVIKRALRKVKVDNNG